MSNNLNVSEANCEAEKNETETITVAYRKDYIDFINFIESKQAKGEYPFRCHKCNFESGLVSRMNWHEWNECVSKVIACIYCRKTFENSGAKQEHIRTDHPEMAKTYFPFDEVIIIDDSSEDSEGPEIEDCQNKRMKVRSCHRKV